MDGAVRRGDGGGMEETKQEKRYNKKGKKKIRK